MNIVIPMAGYGSRFNNSNFAKPKPFIEFLGEAMIFHVLNNLNVENAKFHLIMRAEHYYSESVTVQKIKEKFNVEFILTDKVTEGNACSVLLARKFINNSEPLLIANSDQLVDMDIKNYIDDCNNRHLDGSILVFPNDDIKWSYAKINEDNLVVEIKEKTPISPYATVGIYYYSKGQDYVDAAIDMMANNDRTNGEFYTGPVYNWAVKNGKSVGIYKITPEQMIGLGTPDDLTAYLERNKVENR